MPDSWAQRLLVSNKDSLAEIHFEQALIEARDFCPEDTSLRVGILVDYLQLRLVQRDLDRAESLVDSINLSALKMHPILKAQVLYQQTRYHQFLGDREAYCLDANAAKDQLKSIKDVPYDLRMRIDLKIADCYFQRKEWLKSIESYQQIFKEESFQENPKVSRLIVCAATAGAALTSRNDDRAEDWLRLALSLTLESDSPNRNTYLGFIYEYLGLLNADNNEQRTKNLKQALNYYAEAGSEVEQSKVYLHLGKLALISNDPALAQVYADESLRIVGFKSGDSTKLDQFKHRHLDDFYDPLVLKAEILLEAYKYDEAIQYLEEALDIIQLIEELAEETRNGVYSNETKKIISEHFHRAAQFGLEAVSMLPEHKISKQLLHLVFNLMEHNRYSLLYKDLDRARNRQALGVPDSVERRFERFRAEIERLTFWIKAGPNHSMHHFADSLVIERSNFHDFQQIVAQKYPSYYRIEYDSMISLTEVQNYLCDNEQLFEYFWSDSSIFLLSLTKDTQIFVQIKRLAIDLELKRLLSWLANTYPVDSLDLNFNNYLQLGIKLYTSFIGPYLQPEIERVLISPDGLLSYLPFEILISKSSDADFRTAAYFLRDVELQYIYSSNLYFKDRKSTEVVKPSLLAMAFSSEETDMVYMNNEIPILKYSKNEIQAIQRRLGKKNVTLRYGSAATKLAFEKQVGEHNMVHLAVHGVGNPEHTKDPFMILYGPNSSIDTLYTYELYNLPMDLDMAVLSACETGVGRTLVGEGIFSMSRGFAYSGTAAMVTSLWQVNDETTSQIMDAFYKNLAKGNTMVQSLRLAKLNYLDRSLPGYAIPHYWAGFIGVGNDLSLSRTISNDFLTVGTLFLLFIIALILFFVPK